MKKNGNKDRGRSPMLAAIIMLVAVAAFTLPSTALANVSADATVLNVVTVDYNNTARPHQGLAQQSPIPHHKPNGTGPIQQRKVLGAYQ